MGTRKEDLKALREMQSIKREFQEISEELAALDIEEINFDLCCDEYKTNHLEECKGEKEAALKKVPEEFYQRREAAVKKYAILPWIGIAAGIAVVLLASNYAGLGLLIGIAGFVVKSIIKASISKSIEAELSKKMDELEAEYDAKLEKAFDEDEAEELRYQSDLENAIQKLREENQPEREKLEQQREACEKKLDEIRIISYDDMDNIDALIKILDSGRADNVKEALLIVDEQKRQEEEAEKRHRREEAEAERRRQEEERIRLASTPGTVHVRIGSINTYSGLLKTVRNAIYFDGTNYGPGDANGTTTFQLNPGAHNVYGQLEEAGYLFTSPNQSFTLPGGGDVYIKIMIKNAAARIYLCSSESEFLSN